MEVNTHLYGTFDNQEVQAFTLKNDQGLSVTCIDFGCIITEILAPDRTGNLENVVLGFDRLEGYLADTSYQGAIVGRTAGRTRGGQFDLNGKTYSLDQNENNNHIHGGVKGFSKVVWDSRIINEENRVGVEFTYLSEDGEGGYPGTVEMTVAYTLNNDNEFVIMGNGTPDADTILNITNHAYFNLSGDVKNDVLDHELTIKSNKFLELDEEFLPTGKLLDVTGTVFDFKNGRKIGDGPKSKDEQIVLVGQGYDHPFLLDEKVVQLYDEASGRKLVVETNQPAVVVYTSNTLKGFNMRGGEARPYLGVCLETQGLPDAIHHPNFPSVVIKKGEQYHWETKYTFLAK
ncbi:aldose epimerase family protein [Fredinandcohnia sp. QZ13]|uniref:aldose epimerase family protein n=1 Tax=Fredinandcohnia sp. QZ13 TaxID=3073144 RepID=UPI0028531C72|nr:aldose epimerase family protein [Fredinandcohnia sp. QZ13]MDR4889957.1 aldose epimerase family protein [Fredinandcohnia sp. QZ13]